MKLPFDLKAWGPVTVLVLALVFIVAVAGALVALIQPSTLDFQTYLEDMQRFLAAVAGLGFARAIHLGAREVAAARSTTNPNSTNGINEATDLVTGGPYQPDQGDAVPYRGAE